jgi:hypothetical protein
MGLRIDLHVHTRRHSPCSTIEPETLVRQAVKIGLDGVVITEHHYQWREEDLAALADRSDAASFLLLAGFECSTQHGDLLIYGLAPEHVGGFYPGIPPERAVRMVRDLGGVCVAAHPTRLGMGFDERLRTLGLDAIEVRSTNLQDYEQRLAIQLASSIPLPPIAASDAHRIQDVGCYATEFDDPIQSSEHLQEALRRGKFRPVDGLVTRVTPT